MAINVNQHYERKKKIHLVKIYFRVNLLRLNTELGNT